MHFTTESRGDFQKVAMKQSVNLLTKLNETFAHDSGEKLGVAIAEGKKRLVQR
jgi:hypothetical protein